jgi:hypothetical protein
MRIIALAIVLIFASAQASALNKKDAKALHNGLFLYNPTGPDITSLRASWIVPAEPAVRNGQNLAIWIGLQPEDSKTVLQTVLKWGASSGGNDSWSIACSTSKIQNGGEMVSKSTKAINVHPGQKVTGVVELLSVSSGIYTYRCHFEGHKDSEVTFKTTDKFNTAMLEYWIQNIVTCNDYSENANFSDVRIMAGDTNLASHWRKGPIEDPLKCGIKIRTPSTGSVSIGLN